MEAFDKNNKNLDENFRLLPNAHWGFNAILFFNKTQINSSCEITIDWHIPRFQN